MIELTPHARVRLDDYLAELRRVLSVSPTVDVEEVERDVRDHIDAALHEHHGPVQATVLEEVLRTLGSPRQWLPEADSGWLGISPKEWFDRTRTSAVEMAKQLTRGPESYRLPYLSLLMLAAGWCLASVSRRPEAPVIAGTIFAFVLARAALSLYEPGSLSAAQRWLLYPSLLSVYLPLAGYLIFAAAGTVAVLAWEFGGEARFRIAELEAEIRQAEDVIANNQWRLDEMRAENRPGRTAAIDSLDRDLTRRREQIESAQRAISRRAPDAAAVAPYLFAVPIAVLGANLLLVSLATRYLPGIVRGIFYPFLETGSRDRLRKWTSRLGIVIGLAGLFVSLPYVVPAWWPQ